MTKKASNHFTAAPSNCADEYKIHKELGDPEEQKYSSQRVCHI
jgi:uncharacterized membrane protein